MMMACGALITKYYSTRDKGANTICWSVYIHAYLRILHNIVYCLSDTNVVCANSRSSRFCLTLDYICCNRILGSVKGLNSVRS